MPTGQKKATTITEEPEVAEKKELDPITDFYHFRLKRSSMFNDTISGLNLNALNGNKRGKVQKGMGEDKYLRIREAMRAELIEQINPHFPDPVSETPPPTRKDLRKTTEAKILMQKQKNLDPLIDLFKSLTTKKGGKGILPLKIFHYLETQGHNYANRPRPELVDCIEEQLGILEVTDYRITREDEEGIVVINESPEEYVTNM